MDCALDVFLIFSSNHTQSHKKSKYVYFPKCKSMVTAFCLFYSSIFFHLPCFVHYTFLMFCMWWFFLLFKKKKKKFIQYHKDTDNWKLSGVPAPFHDLHLCRDFAHLSLRWFSCHMTKAQHFHMLLFHMLDLKAQFFNSLNNEPSISLLICKIRLKNNFFND